MRRPVGSWRVAVGAVMVAALIFGASPMMVTAVEAARRQAPSRTPRLDPGAASAPYNPDTASQDDERMKFAHEERRKQIPAGTDRLVLLTMELRDMVKKSSTEQPPAGGVRKAAEIEKLARELKKIMQN